MLDTSGSWRVEVLPVAGSNPFMINVDFQVANVSIGSYAGLASSQRIFIIYNTNVDSYNINVNLYQGNIS